MRASTSRWRKRERLAEDRESLAHLRIGTRKDERYGRSSDPSASAATGNVARGTAALRAREGLQGAWEREWVGGGGGFAPSGTAR